MSPSVPHRRLVLLVGLLFLGALFVRLGYQYQMSSSPLWQAPILDEAVNHHWALEVARGEGWGELPFFRAPLYPWFLGLVYRVLGESPAGARLVQALLSSVTCLLVWWIARRTFSPLAGWCAGVLAATYWPWVYFDAELQDVPLGLFCNLAALAALVTWTPRRRQLWLPAAAGLLLGLSAITRPTVLVVLPAVAGWLWWQAGRADEARWRRRWWAPVLLAAGVAAAVLPVTALNRWVGGDAVLVASQGGMNFYIGNHPGSDGHSARFPGARADWESLRRESRRQAERARGTKLRASQVSDYWYGQGMEFWRRQPASALRLTARKAAYLGGAAELPNNKQIRFLIERYAPAWRRPWLWPGFSLVAPLGLVGLWWGGGGRRSVLLGTFALSYGAAVVAFFVTARFRMPVMAVWIVLAGGGAAALLRLARRGPRRRLLAATVTLLLAAVLVQLPARGQRENAAHGHYTLARAHGQRGEPARAEQEYRRALALQPAFSEALLGWSALLLEGGRADEALPLLRQAVATHPDDLPLRANLALTLQAVDRAQESVKLLQQGLSRRPDQPDLWLWLGNAQMKAASPGDAIASFRRVLELEPARADGRYNLANALMSAGDAQQAVRTYRSLLVDHPDHHGGWNMLGIALSGRGDLEGAVHAFERAVQLQPQSPRAHLNLGQALRRQGSTEAATRQFQRTRELDPGGDAGRQASQLLDE